VILEITGKCSNKTRTGVHFKPESVFILDRNRCSDWAGIRTCLFRSINYTDQNYSTVTVCVWTENKIFLVFKSLIKLTPPLLTEYTQRQVSQSPSNCLNNSGEYWQVNSYPWAGATK